MTQGRPIVHVVGARPNFMKAAPVIRALRAAGIAQRLVHTGQHYDDAMSGIFLRELELPQPAEDLGIGSGGHATQTAAMMVALDRSFTAVPPRLVVVYGDVNSTVAAALVAAKRGIAVGHVESGLRSFDDTMPEEINRRVTDLLSTVLFVTCPEGVGNLAAEGITGARVRYVGNPMIDTLLAAAHRFDPEAITARLGLDGPYAVATIHRPSNVDTVEAGDRVVAMLERLSDTLPVVLPLHPRGRASLTAAGLRSTSTLRVIDPLGYLEFMSLVRGSAVVVTDSGGIQEETTVLGIPCLTIRPNTERPVTITHGTNRLIRPDDVPGAVRALLADGLVAPPDPPPGWDGRAGERIAEIIADAVALDCAPHEPRVETEEARLSSS